MHKEIVRLPNNQHSTKTMMEEGSLRTVEIVSSHPLGESLEYILALLVAQRKITELLPPADPKSKRYDPTKRCAYHSGSPGHTIEHKIQDLIESEDIVVK